MPELDREFGRSKLLWSDAYEKSGHVHIEKA